MYVLVLSGAALFALADHWLHTPHGSAMFTALVALCTTVTVQPVYLFFLKPFLSFFQAQVDKAVQKELTATAQQAASLAAPADAKVQNFN